MNIDKFGHHVHKRLRFSDLLGIADNALLKKENGYYDLQSSRLKGLQAPQELSEAVNKEYVDTIIKDLCTKDEVRFIMSEVLKETERVMNVFINDVYTKHEVDKIIKSVTKDEATSSKRNS
ncbi:hypothetical protein JYU34_013223 [Plutella xylostella]|uniref:Uncharacterized protein n=1 Tax=Plutella xylostella TaxID=51655 RepID=A0ABQ7Q9Q5_PLUXY|nr:hypothetical protein JYU34_013223 [Plutella xylostella]